MAVHRHNPRGRQAVDRRMKEETAMNLPDREPDLVLTNFGLSRPFLRRWHLISENNALNIYLHKWTAPDDVSLGLHDHPWDSRSLHLSGPPLWELQPIGGVGDTISSWMKFPVEDDCRRLATHIHAITGDMTEDDPTCTLFITGPKIREWGFWAKGKPWQHWAINRGAPA